MNGSIYRPLTGKRRRFISFSQLFLGPDHLLLVRSNRFEERYQRFFFKDIQALVVTSLPNRTWMQASLGVLAGVMILLAVTLVRLNSWRSVVIFVGLIPAVIAVVDYFLGERCGAIIKTPAASEPLPPVSRMSVADLVTKSLRRAVEQAQLGEWHPSMATATGPPVMAPRRASLGPGDRILPVLLALVSFDIVLFLAARVTKRNEFLFVLLYSVFTEIVLAISAMRRRGDDPRWVLYALAGVIAVCAVLDNIGGMGVFGYFFYLTAEDQRNSTTNATRILQLSYPQMFMWWGMGWRLVIGAAGWIVFVWSPKEKRGEPSPQ